MYYVYHWKNRALALMDSFLNKKKYKKMLHACVPTCAFIITIICEYMGHYVHVYIHIHIRLFQL